MNATVVSTRRHLLARSLILSLKSPTHSPPATHPPPKKEVDRIAIYAREASLIISDDDSSGARGLTPETQKALIALQRILQINKTPASI